MEGRNHAALSDASFNSWLYDDAPRGTEEAADQIMSQEDFEAWFYLEFGVAYASDEKENDEDTYGREFPTTTDMPEAIYTYR